MCNILSDKLVKIRKPHKCLMCGRDFPAGTSMHYQVNVFDNRINSIYTCTTCQELILDIELNQDYMWEAGCVVEELDAFNFKGTPEEFLEIKRAERKAKLEKKNGNITQ